MSSSTTTRPAAHETPHPQGVRLVVRHGSATDVDRGRDDNEDSLLAAPPVFLVADGMGGHDLGATASARAIGAFEDLVGREVVTSQELSRRLTRAARSVAALGAGGRDNVTVIVVDIVEAFPPWQDTQVDDITLPRAAGSESTVPAPVSRRFRP